VYPFKVSSGVGGGVGGGVGVGDGDGVGDDDTYKYSMATMIITTMATKYARMCNFIVWKFYIFAKFCKK